MGCWLSLHRDMSLQCWAVALHLTTAFANQTAQILPWACDTHSKQTHHVPNHLYDTQSVPTGHFLTHATTPSLAVLYFFFPSPLLPPSLGRALGVLWGRKHSARGISPYQHRAAPKRKFLEVARVQRHAQGW